MSLTLAISLIVLADLALLAGLSYMMSRAKLLTPHASDRLAVTHRASAQLKRPSAATARRHPRRTPARVGGQPVEA